MKYYKCQHCGNLVRTIEDGGVVPMCCGEPMTLLPYSEFNDAHWITYKVDESPIDFKRIMICIGKNSYHPMSIEHYIVFIDLETSKGIHTYFLRPGNVPCVQFFIRKNETILTIYTYCNVHGLYKLDMDE